MIHYHGLPITPETAAAVVLKGGHGFISWAEPRNIGLAVSVCQSFAIDNGAFTAWKRGRPVKDWAAFYDWASEVSRIPSCDFVVAPDVIGGSESENDDLLSACPLPVSVTAPVWHMHESVGRLARLVRQYPRVCLGSSGEFATVGTTNWWARMTDAMDAACDSKGRPLAKLHGLRMLNPKVFSRLPLASADSTNIARNVGIDSAWRGTYLPATKEARALVMRDRIEGVNSAPAWGAKEQQCFFPLF